MGEKRKPTLIIMLNFVGKRKIKLELFDAELFRDRRDVKYKFIDLNSRYRLRANGKWWHGYPDREGEAIFFTKTEIKEILFRGLKP
ncbi:hypothetical protein KAR91_11850 [Candidatus Pacearchaeota archaeon]|nr:hypothetical protein [Candidatus Pacearchaeota archaeon]